MYQEKPRSKIGKPRSLVQGVGVNDANYVTGGRGTDGVYRECPYYATWRAMLERCYCLKFQARSPTYVGCVVAEPWKTFSVFRAWMEQQPWQGKALDKDILQWGNKVYGPDTCLFVSPAVNGLLVLRGNQRGEYPLGVTRMAKGKYVYFQARCSFYGKEKRIGTFKTPEEAAEAYKAAKLAYIAEVAAAESDPKVKLALLAIH